MAHLGTHVVLAGSAVILAVLLGVPLAAVAADRTILRSGVLALAGGFRVVPSLAILALAIPLLGLGFAPAMLALVVLALPPIVVNTDVGLRAVPAATLEAARATGMTPRQVGRRVRWPLALPGVAVGVRTASVEVIASATLAARAMRQVLVEAARRRNAAKRGNGYSVTFDAARDIVACEEDLLGLDTALDELARIQPRQAMMVVSRFFGGVETAEIAELLEVSEATILRDWRAAKAWLAHTLRQ